MLLVVLVCSIAVYFYELCRILTSLVKILSHRPPVRLIRAKYLYCYLDGIRCSWIINRSFSPLYAKMTPYIPRGGHSKKYIAAGRWEVPSEEPERCTFFRIEVYKRMEISRVRVWKDAENCPNKGLKTSRTTNRWLGYSVSAVGIVKTGSFAITHVTNQF